MTITADFELGTLTNTITTADAGSATAWDVASIGAGAAMTYDNTHLPTGSTKAAKLATTATASAVFLQWTTAFPDESGTHFGRVYLYLTANPSAGMVIVHGQNDTPSTAFRIQLNTTGHIELLDNSVTIKATSTNAVGLNQWVRVEWKVVQGTGTAGTFEAKLFNSANSATATETITAASVNTLTTAQRIAFGNLSALANTTMWLDDMVAAASAYPGPFPVNSAAPTVSGSSPVGSTLTANAGTWNGTFTLSHQWQSDGTNISGATGSTYVIQAGDVGHAIGVVETATGQQATNESASQTSSNTITAGGSSAAHLLAALGAGA